MPPLPTAVEVAAERERRSLRAFMTAGWSTAVTDPLVTGWHHDALCEHLQAVTAGSISRLLINLPPRHGKSTLTSVLWPAWVWTTNPQVRFLFASYAMSLAERDSAATRRLIESPWYQERWGSVVRLSSDQNSKARFENTAGGHRIATSVGGSATGEGGDILVVDDPHKSDEATGSPVARAAVRDWFASTISTRLNDPRQGAIVVVGHRLHEDDLFGHLIEQGGWEHLCLPALYEPSHPFCWPGDPRSRPGEPLWPGRFGPAELADLRRSLGSQNAAAQLQQLPAPPGGGIFQTKWWQWYDPARLPQFEQIIQSWDLNFGIGDTPDFVVGQAWGAAGPNKYLLKQARGRLSFTETLAAIRDLTNWVTTHFPGQRGHPICIEQSANGAAVVNVLQQELPGVIPIKPEGSKENRARAVTPQIEAGNVYLPGHPNHDHSSYDLARTPTWVQQLIHETQTFPNGSNDDQVDALTQAIRRLDRPAPQLRVLRFTPRARRW